VCVRREWFFGEESPERIGPLPQEKSIPLGLQENQSGRIAKLRTFLNPHLNHITKTITTGSGYRLEHFHMEEFL